MTVEVEGTAGDCNRAVGEDGEFDNARRLGDAR